jgi:two-component system, OmpR family, response regulator RegX3
VHGGRVLLVEDEASISDPFSELLRLEGYEPVVVRTAQAALDLAGRERFTAVLLDLMLPDGDGRDVCRELRRVSSVPILMLTARGAVTDRIVGLELGADDYVVKPFDSSEVIARLRAIIRRTPQRAAEPRPAPLQFGELRVDLAARRVDLGNEEIALTRKEFDLLAALVRRRGEVARREDLMCEVWDENWFGSTRTLDVHIGWLRRKLRNRTGTERWIQTVRGVGFRFDAGDSR